jgi:hypothetical protein
MASTAAISGTQAGDPVRAGEAMIRVTQEENPPRHLVLGGFGVNAVESKLRERAAEIAAWREVGLATDFPKE